MKSHFPAFSICFLEIFNFVFPAFFFKHTKQLKFKISQSNNSHKQKERNERNWESDIKMDSMKEFHFIVQFIYYLYQLNGNNKAHSGRNVPTIRIDKEAEQIAIKSVQLVRLRVFRWMWFNWFNLNVDRTAIVLFATSSSLFLRTIYPFLSGWSTIRSCRVFSDHPARVHKAYNYCFESRIVFSSNFSFIIVLFLSFIFRSVFFSRFYCFAFVLHSSLFTSSKSLFFFDCFFTGEKCTLFDRYSLCMCNCVVFMFHRFNCLYHLRCVLCGFMKSFCIRFVGINETEIQNEISDRIKELRNERKIFYYKFVSRSRFWLR